MKEILFAITILTAACNSTNSESANNQTDSLQVNVTDTIPFEEVADSMEAVIEEAETINDTMQSGGNIKKGEGVNTYKLNDVKQKLVGSWKWEKTKCCGRNAQWYTDTLQENRVLKFKADNTVEFYQNGKLQKKEKYLLEDRSVYPDRPQITIGDKTMGPALLEFDGDKMMINYGYMDLQIEYYNKVK